MGTILFVNGGTPVCNTFGILIDKVFFCCFCALPFYLFCFFVTPSMSLNHIRRLMIWNVDTLNALCSFKNLFTCMEQEFLFMGISFCFKFKGENKIEHVLVFYLKRDSDRGNCVFVCVCVCSSACVGLRKAKKNILQQEMMCECVLAIKHVRFDILWGYD